MERAPQVDANVARQQKIEDGNEDTERLGGK